MSGKLAVVAILMLGGGLAFALWQSRPVTAPRDRASIEPSVEPTPQETELAQVEEPESKQKSPEKPATVLRVRVVLPDGPRPSGVSAWFRAKPEDTNLNYPARIEGDVVTVRAPFGKGQLSMQVGGCAVKRWMVDVPDGTTADLGPYELRRVPPLRGRVVDETGAPVIEAFVYPKIGDSSVPLQSTRNDGSFAFDGLPEGEAILRVESDSMVRRIVKFHHHVDAEPVEVVLQRGVRLEGRVLDSQGKPYDSTYVSVVDTAAPKDRGRMAFPSVEEDGSFAVQLLPGRYRVRANGEGRPAIEVVEIREPGPMRVTLRLPAR